jgi:nucleotide-binding universal stress UspA family protein
MFEKILVAIDDTESSRIIFDRSLVLAKAGQSELMLMHVIIPVNDFFPGDTFMLIPTSVSTGTTDRRQEQEQAGLDKLQLLESEATAAGIRTEFTQHVGNPGKLICEVAQTWNADLIVIGRRGLSGLSELVMGSVSNHVIHHSPCDVLTIQGNTRTLPQLKIAETVAGAT